MRLRIAFVLSFVVFAFAQLSAQLPDSQAAEYDKVPRDRSMMQRLTLQMPRFRSNRAETRESQPRVIVSNGAILRDAQGKLVPGRILNTAIPPSNELGPVIGPELHHGGEFRRYGSPAAAPDARRHSGGLETDSALNVEQKIRQELEQSNGSKSLTPQEEQNLFDVPADGATNAQECPPMSTMIDPGPSTSARPPE